MLIFHYLGGDPDRIRGEESMKKYNRTRRAACWRKGRFFAQLRADCVDLIHDPTLLVSTGSLISPCRKAKIYGDENLMLI